MTKENIVKLAHRMDQLPPYLFGMINTMKSRKRNAGDDVIDLGMGNPIDPAPQSVILQLCRAAGDPKTSRYPVAGGMKNLRKEVAAYYKRNYAVELDDNHEVICTIGSKEGVSHLSLAIIGPGDCVMVPVPAFPIHIYASVIAGGEIVRIPLSPQETFADRIEKICKTRNSRPKVLMLNYPHNPTGTMTDLAFFQDIVYLAKKYHFMVVHDFAYAKITFDGHYAPSFLEAKGAVDVGVEFGSFSKSYNMAGWRMGYCVGNREMIQGLAKIKGYYDYGIFSPIQVAGVEALRHCDTTVTTQAGIYQNRRDVLVRGLKSLGWDVDMPKAGMFVWVKIPEPFSRMGSMALALELMNRANVAVAPGIGFGDEGEGYLRLALVENGHRIRQAVRQIRKAFYA